MKKMRRAQLHRVRIQYWKDTKDETAKKSQLTTFDVNGLVVEYNIPSNCQL